jgi:hypothetical protein
MLRFERQQEPGLLRSGLARPHVRPPTLVPDLESPSRLRREEPSPIGGKPLVAERTWTRAMLKEELADIATAQGIEVKRGWTKAEIVAQLERMEKENKG